jgi:hypothetical protein
MTLETNGWEKQSGIFDYPVSDLLLWKKSMIESWVRAEMNDQYLKGLNYSLLTNIEKVTMLEIQKSIMRTLLKHDWRSVQLAQDIAKRVKERYPHLKYVTQAYPIIHFPDDNNETGQVHTDGQSYAGAFLTTWTPLNRCDHRPIAVTDLATGEMVTPEPEEGEFLMWWGHTPHEGLLNRSSKVHIAMVIKFTEKPLLNERTALVDELIEVDAKKLYPDEPDTDTWIFIRSSIAFLLGHYNDFNPNLVFGSTSGYILGRIDSYEKFQAMMILMEEKEIIRKRLSFMLALFAQRLEPHYLMKDIIGYYCNSIAMYRDSFLGLQKVVDYMPKNRDNNGFDFATEFMRLYPSKQARFSIDSIGVEFDKLNYENDYPLLKWTE